MILGFLLLLCLHQPQSPVCPVGPEGMATPGGTLGAAEPKTRDWAGLPLSLVTSPEGHHV